MNHMYAYLRNDRKIKFRMVSVQHFINEAPGVGCLRCTDRSASYDESDSKPEPYALLSSSRGTLMSYIDRSVTNKHLFILGNLHLVILQMLLSKATYNWGIHKAINLEEANRQRTCP